MSFNNTNSQINELVKATLSTKNYNLMNDISELQVGSLVKYIKKNDLTKIFDGGRVTSITEETDVNSESVANSESETNKSLDKSVDCNISFENNKSVLLSNVFILYRIKTEDDYKQELFELWMGRYTNDSN